MRRYKGENNMNLINYMFKKRMFPFNCLVPMDKEEFINELRSNTRFVLYLKDNNQAIVYDTTQNYDIDFIGYISSRKDGTCITGYVAHKVSVIEWIIFCLTYILSFIFIIKSFTFSMSNLIILIAGIFVMLLIFVCFPLMSFISGFMPLRQGLKKYYKKCYRESMRSKQYKWRK